LQFGQIDYAIGKMSVQQAAYDTHVVATRSPRQSSHITQMLIIAPQFFVDA
jgi:hypothetical protein